MDSIRWRIVFGSTDIALLIGSNAADLSPGSEECAQQFGGFLGEQPARDGGAVVEAGLGEHVRARFRRLRPWDRRPRRPPAGRARGRSRRRTSRTARASRTGRCRAAASSRAAGLPHAARASRRAPSGRGAARARCAPAAITSPSCTITAPIGTSSWSRARSASRRASRMKYSSRGNRPGLTLTGPPSCAPRSARPRAAHPARPCAPPRACPLRPATAPTAGPRPAAPLSISSRYQSIVSESVRSRPRAR